MTTPKTPPADTCPRCTQPFTHHVEYAYPSPDRYDGISEHVCVPCDVRVGRWTGKILKEGEVEPVFGREEPYVPLPCPSCDGRRNPMYPTCFHCHLSAANDA